MAAKLAVAPPNLAAGLTRRSDGFLYATIRDGGPVMPSQRERVPPSERWDIVNYLRSIAPTEPRADQPPASPTVSSAPPTEEKQAPATAPQSSPGAPGDAARGRAVFEAHCQVCHYADSAEELVGPGLRGLFTWPADTLSDGTEHPAHNRDIIRRQIVEGGGSMAPVGARLSEEEIADLLAYLQTL
jgi:mono/diheme cytochrome c family protein